MAVEEVLVEDLVYERCLKSYKTQKTRQNKQWIVVFSTSPISYTCQHSFHVNRVVISQLRGESAESCGGDLLQYVLIGLMTSAANVENHSILHFHSLGNLFSERLHLKTVCSLLQRPCCYVVCDEMSVCCQDNDVR